MSRTDSQLLRAFADEADEGAFAELVRRRIDFVYGCALRQVGGDAHGAADLTQEVFIALARKARALTGHPTLLGWLCTATRFAAVDAMRSEQKRRIREQEASVMQQNEDETHVDWSKLHPVLDGALTELPQRDREVVLARFFDRQSFAEIGRDFGLSENAAQKRVDRALDRLRAVLARRDVTSTAAALGAALAGHPSVAAPAGLAAAVTQSALSVAMTGGTAAGGGLVLVFMQKHAAILVGVLVVFGLGTTVVGVRAAREAEHVLGVVRHEQAALAQQVRDLEQRVAVGSERVRVAEEVNAGLLRQAESLRSAGAASRAPETELITSDLVQRRFKLAQDLINGGGDAATALRELIWCYDVGMPRIAGMGPVRTTSLLMFARLGERYPPALDFLRERRDKMRQTARASEADHEVLGDYVMMNRALKDDAENVAFLDTLAAGDRRRRTVASASYDYLVENRRYREAAEGKPVSSIASSFERITRHPPSRANPDAERAREFRDFVVKQAATDIEMLAGAGDLENARAHVARVLAFDGTESTRARVREGLARAGRPELLPPAENP